MVADHDTIHTKLHGFLRICHTLDTLQAEWLSSTNHLPLLHQPRHLLPTPRPSMPNIINPHRTSLIRLFLRIDALFLHPFLKHRIRQSQISTNAMVERIITLRLIMMSPRQLPCIKRQYTRREPTLMRPRQQRYRQLVVMRHIELEEPGPFPVRGTNIFDRIRACGGQTIWQIQLFRDFRYRQLPEGVVDLVDADGREANGCADFVPENRGFRVPCVRVNEHLWNYAVAVEGLSVCEVCVGLSCVR